MHDFFQAAAKFHMLHYMELIVDPKVVSYDPLVVLHATIQSCEKNLILGLCKLKMM